MGAGEPGIVFQFRFVPMLMQRFYSILFIIRKFESTDSFLRGDGQDKFPEGALVKTIAKSNSLSILIKRSWRRLVPERPASFPCRINLYVKISVVPASKKPVSCALQQEVLFFLIFPARL